MSSVEILICVLCVVAMTAESRYIPQATSQHHAPRSQFLPSRRANNAFYNDILQRQSNLIRRNPVIPRYISRAENLRQYQRNPARGLSAFNSIIQHSVRNLNRNAVTRNQIRSPDTKIDQSNLGDNLKPLKNLRNRKRKLSINLKFNGHNSADDRSKNTPNNLQIRTNYIHNLKLSNAIKGSDIIINKQGRKTRIHISRRPTLPTNSRSRNVHVPTTHQENQNPKMSAINLGVKTEMNKENRKRPQSQMNYLENGLNEKKRIKFDSVTLNPKAWFVITSKPLTYISTDQTTSTVKTTLVPHTSKDSTAKYKHTRTIKTTSLPSSQMTTQSSGQTASDRTSKFLSSTQSPIQSASTEEIDLPDVPDLPEVPDTTDATHVHSVLD